VTARYIFRRLLHVVPAVAAILVVTFLVIHLAPGDPVIAIAGEDGDQAYYDLMRSKYGLDRSLPAQFFTYVGNVAQGDLGVSYVQGRSSSWCRPLPFPPWRASDWGLWRRAARSAPSTWR
jgi:peptide/nickel transport system permease protein